MKLKHVLPLTLFLSSIALANENPTIQLNGNLASPNSEETKNSNIKNIPHVEKQFEKIRANQLELDEIIQKKQFEKIKSSKAEFDESIQKQQELMSKYLNRPINIYIYSVNFERMPISLSYLNEFINREGNVYKALSKEGNVVDGNMISIPLTIYDSKSPSYYSVGNVKKYISSTYTDSNGKEVNKYDLAHGGFGVSAYLDNVSKNQVSVKFSLERKNLSLTPEIGSKVQVPDVITKSISTSVVISDNNFTVVSIANPMDGNKNIFEIIVIEANPK